MRAPPKKLWASMRMGRTRPLPFPLCRERAPMQPPMPRKRAVWFWCATTQRPSKSLSPRWKTIRAWCSRSRITWWKAKMRATMPLRQPKCQRMLQTRRRILPTRTERAMGAPRTAPLTRLPAAKRPTPPPGTAMAAPMMERPASIPRPAAARMPAAAPMPMRHSARIRALPSKISPRCSGVSATTARWTASHPMKRSIWATTIGMTPRLRKWRASKTLWWPSSTRGWTPPTPTWHR